MSFKTLYFSARNAPECRKMHLNSQISRGSMPPNHPSILPCFAQSIPRFAQSLWATKDEWATEIKNLVAQINFSGHWPKTRVSSTVQARFSINSAMSIVPTFPRRICNVRHVHIFAQSGPVQLLKFAEHVLFAELWQLSDFSD